VVRDAATKAMAQEMSGDWIFNRRSWARTEAGITVFDAGVSVTPQDNGDILFGSLVGETSRLEPIGNGVWRSVKRGSHLIYAKDANGVPTLWAGNGTGSAVRAGLFQRPLWLIILFALALAGATAATLRGAWSVGTTLRAPRPVRFAEGSVLAASLCWMIGLGAFFTSILSAIPDDGASLLFSYPGPMVWIAWTIAAAALLTVVALAGLPTIVRDKDRGLWSRIRRAMLLLVFALAAITCWNLGLIGYTGF
jgi:hypothetical protein